MEYIIEGIKFLGIILIVALFLGLIGTAGDRSPEEDFDID